MYQAFHQKYDLFGSFPDHLSKRKEVGGMQEWLASHSFLVEMFLGTGPLLGNCWSHFGGGSRRRTPGFVGVYKGDTTSQTPIHHYTPLPGF